MERSGQIGIQRLRSGGRGVNVFLVTGPEPVLIDAGMPGSGPALLAEIQATGVQLSAIVLTHADPDHIGAAEFLRVATGAVLCAPQGERGVIEGSERRAPWARRLASALMLRGQPGPAVDRWLDDGAAVGPLTVVSTPGHTRGHVSLVLDRSLLAGDAVDTAGTTIRERPRLLTEDQPAARRTIERLAQMDLAVCYCGHGPPVENASQRLRELVATWSRRTL